MSLEATHILKIDSPLVRLLHFGNLHSHCAFFITTENDFKAAIGAVNSISIENQKGAFQRLEDFQSQTKSAIAGYLGYDLKNDLENLSSRNSDILDMPGSVFFEPEAWLYFAQGELKIEATNQKKIDEICDWLQSQDIPKVSPSVNVKVAPTTSRSEYISKAESIKSHLKRGDIYEANYCIQFSGSAVNFDPVSQFETLLSLTQSPFSVFAKLHEAYILSASPERYLKNTGGVLISQPIKGTIKRSAFPEEDEQLIKKLQSDPKEQSENVMIVDLVRNDLSRVAQRDSVQVKELFGIGTFKTVHHLISTISARLNTDKYSHWDVIKATFPMGSMTGAPKISAMKIIDSHENFKRGIYSGAFGWIDPSGDFDFNVLIRTIIYNQKTAAIGFSVGSAITINAIPEQEYDECLLKAEALINSLNTRFLEAD